MQNHHSFILKKFQVDWSSEQKVIVILVSGRAPGVDQKVKKGDLLLWCFFSSLSLHGRFDNSHEIFLIDFMYNVQVSVTSYIVLKI